MGEQIFAAATLAQKPSAKASSLATRRAPPHDLAVGDDRRPMLRSCDFSRMRVHPENRAPAPATMPRPLAVSRPSDADEREAEAVADAIVRGQPARPSLRMGAPPIQRACAACEEEEARGGLTTDLIDDEAVVGGLRVRRKAQSSRPGGHDLAAPLTFSACRAAPPSLGAGGSPSLNGGGVPLPPPVRAFFEPRLGRLFGDVRVHLGDGAARAARALHAHAFTIGRDIAFAPGQFAPHSPDGLRLLAHELAHVIQQSGAAGPRVHRRVAADAAAAGPLTPVEVAAAVGYNEQRFVDPFSLRIVRELVGIAAFPAISDEALAQAVATWQVGHGLDADGKLGPDTTAAMARALAAGGERRRSFLLQVDNRVDATPLAPLTRHNCAQPPPRFRWDVAWRTTLRGGFIAQRVENVFNGQTCGGGAYPVAAHIPTPRYWEAWLVDNAGRVTPIVGGRNDRWQRQFAPGTRGNWSMTGTTYTVLELPAAAGFAAGAVHDAGILQSTLVRPSDDALGLPTGARRQGGRWDCCPPNNTHTPA